MKQMKVFINALPIALHRCGIEIYEKDQKYLTVYDTYSPNYNSTAVTAKFYSRYEGKFAGEYPEIVEKIKAVKDRGPKEKLKWPETTNQCYGWYLEPLVELDRNDHRLYFPQKSTEMVKHQIRIVQQSRLLKNK